MPTIHSIVKPHSSALLLIRPDSAESHRDLLTYCSDRMQARIDLTAPGQSAPRQSGRPGAC